MRTDHLIEEYVYEFYWCETVDDARRTAQRLMAATSEEARCIVEKKQVWCDTSLFLGYDVTPEGYIKYRVWVKRPGCGWELCGDNTYGI